jgi:hypothetical protein
MKSAPINSSSALTTLNAANSALKLIANQSTPLKEAKRCGFNLYYNTYELRLSARRRSKWIKKTNYIISRQLTAYPLFPSYINNFNNIYNNLKEKQPTTEKKTDETPSVIPDTAISFLQRPTFITIYYYTNNNSDNNNSLIRDKNSKIVINANQSFEQIQADIQQQLLNNNKNNLHKDELSDFILQPVLVHQTSPRVLDENDFKYFPLSIVARLWKRHTITSGLIPL